MRTIDRYLLIWRTGIIFATLGPAERRAKVEAARKRIQAAEARRRELERQRRLDRANKIQRRGKR